MQIHTGHQIRKRLDRVNQIFEQHFAAGKESPSTAHKEGFLQGLQKEAIDVRITCDHAAGSKERVDFWAGVEHGRKVYHAHGANP